jgi:potassium-transporting ATPase KdpC subunit
MKKLWRQLKISVKLLGILTVLLGFAYPLLVTGLANIFFPSQAHGSLLKTSGQVIGSVLIGQQFTSPGYFHGRPSVTGYQSAGASNISVAGVQLASQISDRMAQLEKENPEAGSPIPVDLLTSSGSGLDPDISPAAANYQIPRIAKARDLDPEVLRNLVAQQMQKRQLLFLGEPRVNVLELNLALDKIQ